MNTGSARTALRLIQTARASSFAKIANEVIKLRPTAVNALRPPPIERTSVTNRISRLRSTGTVISRTRRQELAETRVRKGEQTELRPSERNKRNLRTKSSVP